MSSEAIFLRQLQSGDISAFAAFVAVHQKNVLNLCYRFLLNKEDAEDVTQEVFLEAWHGLSRFRGESKLSTWLYRIAVSKSLDELKRRKRKKRISSLGTMLGLDQIVHWAAAEDRPDKSLEEKEDYSRLLETLNNLPENQRIALTLSKIEDHGNAEIAEIMQISLTAVDSLIYRAKQQIKKASLRQNDG